MEQKQQVFLEDYFGSLDFTTKELPKSGSSRSNTIVSHQGKKYVLTHNQDIRENNCFFYFTKVLKQSGINVPEIYHTSEDKTMYLQEFLASTTLMDILQKDGHSPRVKRLFEKSIDQLFLLQTNTHEKVDYQNTFEYQSYGELAIWHDLFYFKNFFVDMLDICYHKETLLHEFQSIAKQLASAEPRRLMIRDFQSRNIMVDHKDNVSFIDYQSAMLGPICYDVSSLLYQAKANLPEQWKQELTNRYFAKHPEYNKEEKQKMMQYCLLLRLLQVLGAYGRRGLIEKKQHFLQSIEQGVKNIGNFINCSDYWDKYPELKQLIQQLETPSVQTTIKEKINA